MVLGFAEVSGICWIASQCSTILPLSSKRKKSMVTYWSLPGQVWCVWSATKSPSAITRTNAMLFSGYSFCILSKYSIKPWVPLATSGLCWIRIRHPHTARQPWLGCLHRRFGKSATAFFLFCSRFMLLEYVIARSLFLPMQNRRRDNLFHPITV